MIWLTFVLFAHLAPAAPLDNCGTNLSGAATLVERLARYQLHPDPQQTAGLIRDVRANSLLLLSDFSAEALRWSLRISNYTDEIGHPTKWKLLNVLKQVPRLAPSVREELARDIYRRHLSLLKAEDQQRGSVAVEKALAELEREQNVPMEKARMSREFLLLLEQNPRAKQVVLNLIDESLPTLALQLRYKYRMVIRPVQSALLDAMALGLTADALLLPTRLNGSGDLAILILAIPVSFGAHMLFEKPLQRLSSNIVAALGRAGYTRRARALTKLPVLPLNVEASRRVPVTERWDSPFKVAELEKLKPALTQLTSASIQEFGHSLLNYELKLSYRLMAIRQASAESGEHIRRELQAIGESLKASKKIMTVEQVEELGTTLFAYRVQLTQLAKQIDECTEKIQSLYAKVEEFRAHAQGEADRQKTEAIVEDLTQRIDSFGESATLLDGLLTSANDLGKEIKNEVEEMDRMIHTISMQGTIPSAARSSLAEPLEALRRALTSP